MPTTDSRINTVLPKLMQSIELDALLKNFLDCVQEALDLDGAVVNTVSPDQDSVVCSALVLPSEFEAIASSYLGYQFPLDSNDPNVEIFKSKTCARFTSKDQLSHSATRTRYERWKMNELMIVPILSDAAAVATLMLFTCGEKTIDENEVKKFALQVGWFGKQIENALVLHDARAKLKSVEHLVEEKQRLTTFLERITGSQVKLALDKHIPSEFLSMYPFDMSTLILREGNQLSVLPTVFSSDEFEHVKRYIDKFFQGEHYELDTSDGATSQCYLQNSRMYVTDIQKIMHLPMSQKDRGVLEQIGCTRTLLIVPLRHENQPLGVLWLWSFKEVVDLSDDQLQFLESLCAVAGTAIANAQSYATMVKQTAEIEALNSALEEKVQLLAEQTITDNLTGLKNFKAFSETIALRVEDEKRSKSSQGLSVIIFDLDKFKLVNDTYGHLAGNAVLKKFAEIVQMCARKVDTPCRYGGEEFVLLLPDCSIDNAYSVAERVRKQVEDTMFNLPDGQILRATVSCGCSQFDKVETIDEFIERADKALYRAKNEGRNRVLKSA